MRKTHNSTTIIHTKAQSIFQAQSYCGSSSLIEDAFIKHVTMHFNYLKSTAFYACLKIPCRSLHLLIKCNVMQVFICVPLDVEQPV